MNFRALLPIGLLAFGPLSGGLAYGQILHASGERPSFEVATIKPWKPSPPPPPPSDGSAPAKPMKLAPVGVAAQSSDRVHMILPVALLIASAYNIPVGSEKRLIQGPASLRLDDQFEIQAKIEGSLFAAMLKMTAQQQQEQVALMEQSLLAERFGLKVHFEMKEMPVYALVAVKGGPKLAPAKDGELNRLSLGNAPGGKSRGLEMTATAVALEDFVRSPFLTGAAGRQVVDQTDLKGAYDFVLSWQPDMGDTADAPSLFTAIQEQLGLRLVPTSAKVEVIVVDHIEPPSAN